MGLVMIEQLRRRLLALQRAPGRGPRIENSSAALPAVLPLGIAAIDTMLGGGLMRGALHEIAAPAETHLAAATGFALGISSSWPGIVVRRTASLCSPMSRPSTSCLLTLPEVVDARHKAGHDGRSILWIAEEMARVESGAPHGAGLDAFGLAPERLVTVNVTHRRDLLLRRPRTTSGDHGAKPAGCRKRIGGVMSGRDPALLPGCPAAAAAQMAAGAKDVVP